MAAKVRDNTQDDRTLRLLESQTGAWVPASELVKVSLQYCRVIASLRSKGFEIENRLEVRNGTRFGFYRLIRPIAKAAIVAAPQSLFSDDLPERPPAYPD